MLIILLHSIIVLLSVVLVITLFNALFGPMLKRAPAPQTTPRVSVLIPARNEEHNIGACLEGLRKQNYPELEILVLDDGSTDRTAEIVQRFAREDVRIKLIAGTPLPSGWLGKTWACHQLSMHASGDIFVFTDADNRHAPSAVTRTVGWMQHLHLGMLSAFTQQFTKTLPEKLVVPVVNMFVFSYLPLWLTYYSKNSSLAAANGQWIAFTRNGYQTIGGHRAVRNQVVEDVELSRLAKKMGMKILTVAGTGEVFSRMYHSFPQLWEGYSKNIFGLTGFRTMLFFAILLMLFGIHIVPYFLVWFAPLTKMAALAIALNIAIRLVLALRYNEPLFVSTLLHPLSIAFIILIGLNSYRWYKTGKIRWKGRHVAVSVS
ncbi:MAG: glycosyltransferase family 2 protein [candidate division KSB1 bacterium]|nr:glycosyltransferase family 2 protein [candidate division KSB1 bacterium]MDZ7304015.1 glycosyltransferase family 2 protein [candidate division KSB1 bacterium]MDZ7313275.1 glycosyltransferase family 2 protein [candidate division KSB1 bacterium]